MRMRLVASIVGLGLAGLALAQEPATPPAAEPASAPAAAAPATTAPAAASSGAASSAPAGAAPTTTAAPSTNNAEPGPATPGAEPTLAAETPAVTDGPGDAARGATKAAACGACHGTDGNAADAQYPKLAGQHAQYTHRQLELYKNGGRQNAIMVAFAAPLSAQDMRDLGAYFATQKGLPGVANEARIPDVDPAESWVDRGQRLYRGGSAAAGTPACMACHGPTGHGNPGAAYPAVAGQHADYTKLKLAEFRDGTVWGKDAQANSVMAQVAKTLSDTDIEALATYIEGLHAVQRASEPAP